VSDCLCWLCCPLCAVCQEKRELAARGIHSWQDFQRMPQKIKSRRSTRASGRKSRDERKSNGAALTDSPGLEAGAPGAVYEAGPEAGPDS